MNCEDLQPLLGAHMDGELDLVTSMKAEEHLAQCPACQALMEKQAILGAAIAEHVPRYTAPEHLRARVLALVASEREAAVKSHENQTMEAVPARQTVSPRRSSLAHFSSEAGVTWVEVLLSCGGLLNRSWAQVVALAVVAIAAFCAGSVVRFPLIPFGSPVMANSMLAVTDEAVSNHVRSLLAAHLADVPSTDQHTVKPWFAGKLDYSPTVVDLAASGFPLTGGRLDVLQNRPVAALIYQRRKHIINLFVQPDGPASSQHGTGTASPERPATAQRNGYNIVSWQHNGMTFTAVSDVSEPDLLEFARLLTEQTAPAPAKG